MRKRHPLIVSFLPAVAACALLAAGCGGGGSPRVASVASSTAAAATQNAQGAEMVAFSRCMHAHGVPNFPDPQHFAGGDVKLALRGYGPNNPHVHSAMNACEQLLPNNSNSGPPLTDADHVAYLKAAACMRRNGIPDFPDPTFQNNSVQFNIPSSIEQNTSVAVRTRAVTICRKLIPPGLPYSA